METFLGTPVLIRGEPWGNLYMTEKHGRASFTAADEEAAVILAEWAGKRGRALVDAGGVMILLREGEDLVVAATAGAIPTSVRGSRVPAAAGGNELRNSVETLGPASGASLLVPQPVPRRSRGIRSS